MPLHRRVFFIAGFDPKSPRYYHRLYRERGQFLPYQPQMFGRD